MKDKIAHKIAYLLPNRVMLWAIVRAFAHATCGEYGTRNPDATGYSDVYKSWEKLL